MDIAIQVISNDQTVRNDTVQDLKDLTLNLQQRKLKRRTTSVYDAYYTKVFWTNV